MAVPMRKHSNYCNNLARRLTQSRASKTCLTKNKRSWVLATAFIGIATLVLALSKNTPKPWLRKCMIPLSTPSLRRLNHSCMTQKNYSLTWTFTVLSPITFAASLFRYSLRYLSSLEPVGGQLTSSNKDKTINSFALFQNTQALAHKTTHPLTKDNLH